MTKVANIPLFVRIKIATLCGRARKRALFEVPHKIPTSQCLRRHTKTCFILQFLAILNVCFRISPVHVRQFLGVTAKLSVCYVSVSSILILLLEIKIFKKSYKLRRSFIYIIIVI